MPFPCHTLMHGAGKFGLTQLANVARLPALREEFAELKRRLDEFEAKR